MTTTDPQQFWDDLYGERPQIWSGKVNAPLEQRVIDLPPGRVLDLARAEADRRGLAITWVQQDLADALPAGPYDLVSAQFLQSPVPFERIEVLRRAAAEVTAGGLLLVVGHASGPPWSTYRPDPTGRSATSSTAW